MAKQKRKAQLVRKPGQAIGHIEEEFDDNLLPDAEEIAKLHQIDPKIMEWLKERAEKEQEFRHKAYFERINLVKKNERGSRWINYAGLFFSFILLGGGMVYSYKLIMAGHTIIGSIFSGVVLLSVASMFLSKVKGNNSIDRE